MTCSRAEIHRSLWISAQIDQLYCRAYAEIHRFLEVKERRTGGMQNENKRQKNSTKKKNLQ
jgi:hypothetical protein